MGPTLLAFSSEVIVESLTMGPARNESVRIMNDINLALTDLVICTLEIAVQFIDLACSGHVHSIVAKLETILDFGRRSRKDERDGENSKGGEGAHI